MKQLARTAVFWPGIDTNIEETSRGCTGCGEQQNMPAKAPIHLWILPEKPWSRVHVDHAVNFLGSNWLVMVDAYSKYPCIHQTTSTSSKTTIDLLEEDFAHFGYPHTLVTDNATSFTSEEFQEWCKSKGIVHLTGAPYHPATNGAAERLIQTFKNGLKKSSLPPKKALQEFLIHYRRTPFATGYSPSELLNGRQIRTLIDTLAPSPAHQSQALQQKQMRNKNERQLRPTQPGKYRVGSPCYALYCGPKRDKDPRWVPAIVTKVRGSRSVHVRVILHGPTWRRHIEQLKPRYPNDEDDEPGENYNGNQDSSTEDNETLELQPPPIEQPRAHRNPRWPTGSEYGPENPRRSERLRAKGGQITSG
jgi:hypothetical protein